MYLKEKIIKFLKIKNAILTAAGIFEIVVSISIIISLVSHYSDNLKIVLEAKAFPECVAGCIIGIVLLIIAYKSRAMIGDAYFYSSYFELDLSGYIKYSELAEITGKSESLVRLEMHFFRVFYMKKYEIQDDEEQIVLYSKVCACECSHCGAPIEKRIYFTGVCSYCGSSDLFARVLTDNRFYSISNHMSEGIKNPDFYRAKRLSGKMSLYLIFIIIGSIFMMISTAAVVDNVCKYNDENYLVKVLLSGESYSSFKLIKAEIVDTIIAFITIFVICAIITYRLLRKMCSAGLAKKCSVCLAGCKTPFITIMNMMRQLNSSNKKRTVKKIRGSLRRGYLRNCTFEVHDGVLKIALAKTIIKDKCPSCRGPIIDAVDINYKCRYCDTIIMNVMKKSD